MTWLLAAAALLGLVWLGLQAFLSASPARLARILQASGVVLLFAASTGFVLSRQPVPALFAAGLGGALLWLVRRPRQARRPTRTYVRTAGLEMVLDYRSGRLDGLVLAGRFEGAQLSKLSLAECLGVRRDLAADPESLRLLESYLDRLHPGWRDDAERDGDPGLGAAAQAGEMSAEEAYEILGLQPGAGEAEIREAYLRLMKQVHPDRGGTKALAAKLNEAKDRLLDKHR